MLSIGIIWNCANFLKEDILKDVSQVTHLLDYFELDLGNKYIEFVNDIYASENMETWKIEKKVSHMETNPNTKITILFFEFDEKDVAYHPFKNKNIFVQLENCKMHIREKYKDIVQNYTFDIIFHTTDNLIELRNCFDVIVSYLKRLNNDELIDKKVLKLENHKDFNKGNENE